MNIRKIILAALIFSLSLTLGGCGGGAKKTKTDEPTKEPLEVSAGDIVHEIMQSVYFPEMTEVTQENFASFYNIKNDMYADYKGYVSSNPVKTDEIIIFERTGKDDDSALVDGLIARWEQQTNSFKNYDEQEYLYVRDKGFVKVNGYYVIYIVCDNPRMAESVFDKYEPPIPVIPF